ncbi:MAG: hypothetical protein OSB67_05075, partial [Alphaproteobacteria bacterium]|nr:hypothetical protein [Alphaproteobacteria bacterium]
QQNRNPDHRQRNSHYPVSCSPQQDNEWVRLDLERIKLRQAHKTLDSLIFLGTTDFSLGAVAIIIS